MSKRQMYLAMKVGEKLTFKKGEFNICSARCTLTQLKELTGRQWVTKKEPDCYTIERTS